MFYDMAGLFPYGALAFLYAYPAALAILNFKKFRDWPSLSLVPSFLWMALFFCLAPYMPDDIEHLWGNLAFIALSISVSLTMMWRYSMLRGAKWIR